MEYLVVLEISKKQSYIFKTNRMAENIGASIIIREISEMLPKSILENELGIEYDMVLSGGGKSVYAFSSSEDAKAFTKAISKTVLTDYHGVELFMATCGYDDENESIIDAINALYGKLEEKKSARLSTFRIYDLGINSMCESTGLPAVTKDRGKSLSSESALKLETAKKKQSQTFVELLPEDGKYRFANEFSELTKGNTDKSYIAIVTMDGNKMGRKIEKFHETFKKENASVNKATNEKYKKEILELSTWIDGAYKEAVKKAFKKLAVPGQKVLPVRPLILAGDDISFVTDAKIGIALSKEILKNIEEIDTSVIPALKGEKMRACGGIAFVKEKYPFFRAHELAEELCSNAKSIIENDEDESVLDFHIVQGEIEGTISEIRRDKYNNGVLTNKPLYLNEHKNDTNNMKIFDEHMNILRRKDLGRGVVKELRDALREGRDATKQYILCKRLDIDANKCYMNDRCVYFDIIELLDLYESLEGIYENI